MMQTVTVAASVAVWWSAACRIGQMDRAHHRLSVMLGHWALSSVSLGAGAWALVRQADQTALGVAMSGLLYVVATLPDWADGPPAWTRRGCRAAKTGGT